MMEKQTVGMRQMQPATGHDTERGKTRVGRRTLWSYGLLTLALLAPGLALRWLGPVVDEAAVSPLRLTIHTALEPIAFGSGLRFWLGVTGTAMMALLLLYPLRKRLGLSRFTGSVGSWFHSHLALGLIGPALILYHANFGFGSFNANVALWSVGIVVASGFIALTVYLTASEGMARARDDAAGDLDDLLRILRPPGYHDLAGTRLAEDIRAIHQRLEENKGLIPNAALRREKAMIVDAAIRYVHEVSLKAGASPHEGHQLAAGFETRLRAAFRKAARAARSAAIERGLRLWRLLHLPVIAVGAIATTLHVYAVWGVYDEAPSAPSLPPPTLVAPPAPIAKSRPAASVEIAGVRQTPFAAKPPVTVDHAAAAVTAKTPELKQGPVIAERARASNAEPKQESAAQAAAKSTPPIPTSFQPPPAPRGAKPSRTTDDGAAAVAELKRRNDAAPQRIGELNGLTLAAKIAELKSGNFDHARTNFPLTGRHKRVACESCHTKTLIGTPRDCIACHKKDDVHRGRRLDCAACHTTNRWSEIVRRR